MLLRLIMNSAYVYVYVYVYIYVCVYVLCVCVCICICICTYMYMYMCMYMYMYMYVYVYVHVHVYVYVCNICICTCTCMNICMCVCIWWGRQPGQLHNYESRVLGFPNTCDSPRLCTLSSVSRFMAIQFRMCYDGASIYACCLCFSSRRLLYVAFYSGAIPVVGTQYKFGLFL